MAPPRGMPRGPKNDFGDLQAWIKWYVQNMAGKRRRQLPDGPVSPPRRPARPMRPQPIQPWQYAPRPKHWTA